MTILSRTYGLDPGWVHLSEPDTLREEIHAGDALDCPKCEQLRREMVNPER